LAGKLLVSNYSAQQKVKYLLMAAFAGLILCFGLDLLNISPIIKRIATSSFTLASGGWVFLMMAFWYWLVDFKGYSKYAWIAVVVGANAIFIYLFFETVGYQWVNCFVAIFIKGFFGIAGVTPKISAVLSALATWLLEWGLCYWLARSKVFIKL
jgi:predicted acyltransferase